MFTITDTALETTETSPGVDRFRLSPKVLAILSNTARASSDLQLVGQKHAIVLGSLMRECSVDLDVPVGIVTIVVLCHQLLDLDHEPSLILDRSFYLLENPRNRYPKTLCVPLKQRQ